MRTLLTGLCVVLAIISPVMYIVSILRGTSKPHRLTRFALMIVLSLTAVSSYAVRGVTSAFILASVYAAQAIIVFALSIWKGVGGRSRTDVACLGVVAIGLCGWLFNGDALVGLLCFVAADLAAYVPAVIKTYIEPDTETHWTYTLSVLSAFCGLLADGFVLTAVFQLYLMFIGCVMLVCIKQDWLLRRIPLSVFRTKQPLEQESSSG